MNGVQTAALGLAALVGWTAVVFSMSSNNKTSAHSKVATELNRVQQGADKRECALGC